MLDKSFLAFDLGATSGRSILATIRNGKLEMRELTRFPNAIMEVHGKYYWDIFSLYQALKEGLVACAKEGVHPDSIGIDTWGVDFVAVAEDGTLLSLPRAYRDPYTDGAPEAFFKIVPKEKVYELTGIQIMNFNSLYQLFAGVREQFAPMLKASKFLFVPDALSYLLTGQMVCEYTIASTSQILNPRSRQFEGSLLQAAGVRPDTFLPPVEPGTKVGELTDALAQETGIGKVPVVTVAGHDTASAVVAVPAENEKFAYLSSGTWSLMGIEVEEPIITPQSYDMNFTNEGGIEGTTRFLKNITGMWLLEQCRKEWSKSGRDYSYPEIVKMAGEAEAFRSLINPDDATFANPASMTQAIADYCRRTGQPTPETDAQYIRCIFESLALRYHQVLDMLKSVAPFAIEKLHVIGGGSQNKLLNQWTANAIGMPVVAGPSEATAIGNCMMQAKAAGVVASRQEMRRIIAQSVSLETFEPKDTELWDNAYERFQKMVR
ncbi:MAG: rhamnulokinase [Bacteroidales bacterium]|nr:rhamnulokinase [Bacteroidales bacterium]